MTKELKPLLVDIDGKLRLLRPHRLYDKPDCADRFTLVFMDDPLRDPEVFGAFGFDEDPTHPLGIGMHCVAQPGRHLGRRIGLQDLPDKARRVAIRELEVDLQQLPLDLRSCLE
jgi:hypothetical protein